jgi:hypothetical protein
VGRHTASMYRLYSELCANKDILVAECVNDGCVVHFNINLLPFVHSEWHNLAHICLLQSIINVARILMHICLVRCLN